MTIKKEHAILNGLLYNPEFSGIALPYIKNEYFENKTERIAFDEIYKYTYKYNTQPSPEELYVEVNKRDDLSDDDSKNFKELFDNVLKPEIKLQTSWLKDTTETFCKDKALYNAISNSIQIYEGNDKKHGRDNIPEMIRDALSVSFDNSVGHDYFVDAEKAFEHYNSPETLIKFKLDIFNKITAGGITTKTLNVFMGGTNTFKTGFLCDFAASYLDMGYDVLYVTLEMSEYKIRERIDANLTHLRMREVKGLLRPDFLTKIENIHQRTTGRLIIKEYPSVSANANHFRALLKDLEIKKQFKPKIIMIDYLSICASVRVKDASNLYSYNKSIAEEMRGFAQETDTVVWTGMQTNRGGQTSSDPTFDDTAESHGVPMTADILWAIVNTEELESRGLIMIKQLKSRFEDKTKYRRIILGVDRERMTVYELDKDTIDRFDLNPENILKDNDKDDSKPIMPMKDNFKNKFKFN